jgi:phosphoribosylamine---glycine ligase
MKILVVGNGGREHALLWKLSRDAPDAHFFITLGNGGTGALATPLPISPTDIEGIAAWAEQEGIDLTVVGPEIPLAAGIVDRFRARGLRIFGPTRAAAEIESSKAFAKDLMKRHGIPTAGYEVFDDLDSAKQFVRSRGAPLVVKASGLAAGKGAVVCETTEDALATVEEMLGSGVFGEAGSRVVIEEFMEGEELSVFGVCTGEEVVLLLPAQDHKRIGEGDQGPNTGGMGAYAPVAIATPELMDRIHREVMEPTVRALASEGRPFQGFLYAGLMLTPEGPKVVEFNCRFGDPEAEVVLPMLQSSLLELLLAATDEDSHGSLDAHALRWRPGYAVTTVLASGGYPGEYATGMPIRVPPDLLEMEHVAVFHAGTVMEGDLLVTSGGRVMAVTGWGETVEQAAERSRSAAARIDFRGRIFRRDIAWREIGRSYSRSSSENTTGV